MNYKLPLGIEIKTTSVAIKKFIDANVVKDIGRDLSSTECMTIHFLYRNIDQGMTFMDVMARLRLSKARTSELLASLKAKGLIKTKSSKSDRRKKLLTLTKEGLEIAPEVQRAVEKADAMIESQLSQKQLEEMYESLEAIREYCEKEVAK